MLRKAMVNGYAIFNNLSLWLLIRLEPDGNLLVNFTA